MGTLYGVSVGAGDPGLMTLRAVRIMESCGVIAVPRTHGENSLALSIAEQAANLSRKRKVYLDFPMCRDREALDRNYDETAEMLCGLLESDDVAVPTLGDISVYSTFSRIAKRVEKRGHKVEICAGVTSFSVAAASLGKPLCLGSEPLHILPYGCGDFEKLLDLSGTKVVMKTGSKSSELIALLRKKGLALRTSVIENCGLENERIFGSLDEVTDDLGYFTVFIIGECSDET